MIVTACGVDCIALRFGGKPSRPIGQPPPFPTSSGCLPSSIYCTSTAYRRKDDLEKFDRQVILLAVEGSKRGSSCVVIVEAKTVPAAVKMQTNFPYADNFISQTAGPRQQQQHGADEGEDRDAMR